MPKTKITKAKPPVSEKDFTKFPWTEEFRAQFPTEIVKKYAAEYPNLDDLRDFLFVEKHMDFRKSNLLVGAYAGEMGIVRNDSDVLLEIGVPICDNQCSNCDRVIYKQSHRYYDRYFESLVAEVQATRDMIRKKGYFVKAICFTGNLLAFDPVQIEQILTLAAFPLCEINIELSDARHLTREKLDVVKKFANVRFILNALTFNMVTLRCIHKHFELREVRAPIELLVEYGFEISIRLVVGLEKERDLQLMRSIKTSLEFGVTCIDLFARFCPKNTILPLTDDKAIVAQRKIHQEVNDYLLERDFEPYFLYCTEVENGCFENVGFCKFGHKSKYVEDRMFGVSTVIGCGVCAESLIVKNLPKSKKKYRNTTNLVEYVRKNDLVIAEKLAFFD